MRKEKEMRQEIFLNMWKSCQRLQLIYTKKKKPAVFTAVPSRG